MGRPLRAVYANTTYSNGVQEMSDAEIASVIVPVVLNYIVANPDTSYGSKIRTVGTDPYAVAIGSALDTINQPVDAHPASNSSSTAGTLYQTQRTNTNSFTSRPLQYVINGGEVKITEMTDSDMNSNFYPLIVNTMLTGGRGSYYLGLTTGGAPVTGTWTSYGTINDTYYVGSTLTTDQYTLWQRTDAASVGTVRPLRYIASGDINKLQEMTDSDIQTLAAGVGEYIRTTGIGTYAFQISAPGSGTWVSRGSFYDRVNDLTAVQYTGYFPHSFTGAFTGVYSQAFTGVYSQAFTGIYSQAFTGIYSNIFTGIYSQAFTGIYSRVFTGTNPHTY